MMERNMPTSEDRAHKAIHFAVADAHGRYVMTGSAPPGSELPAGAVVLGRPADPRSDYHDHATGAPTQMPKRPSENHKFDFSTKAWFDARTPETEWAEVRKKRDALLRNTDFTQLSDSPRNKQAWAAYRQALRDITKQADPFSLVWPEEPEA